MTLPLSGIRVLELGNYIAAPTAGRLLADFGAEVIKVERPVTGDELRNWRLYAGDTSMLFRAINRNKKSIALDLKSAEGRQAVLELTAHCDVVLENFRPGTLERWGLGPDDLNRANSAIILTRVSAFGQTGPQAKQPGFAAVAEAVGGFRQLVGDPDRPPVRVGVSIGDSIAGVYAAFGTVVALLQRERSDDVSTLSERSVDVALNEAMLSMMESLIPDYSAYGVRRERTGGRMQGIAPSNAYLCSDGRAVVIAGNSDSIFQRFMQVIDRPDLADDSELSTNAQRWDRRDELDAAIGKWTALFDRDETLGKLESAGVPAGPIYTAEDILDDAQFKARNMIQTLPVDIGDPIPAEVAFAGIVPIIGGTRTPITTVGPDLGQHTHEVMTTLLGRSDIGVGQ